MLVSLEHVTPAHVATVAAGMRACDRDEVWASHRFSPLRALEAGMDLSTYVRAGCVDGEAVCLLGVGPTTLLSRHGRPWMLATPGLERIQRPFLRLSAPVVEVMLDFYPTLTNHVDARNTKTLRWLRWLGFTLDPVEPVGIDQRPFHRFWRTRHV